MTLIKYRLINKRISRASAEGQSAYLGDITEYRLDEDAFHEWLMNHDIADRRLDVATVGRFLHDDIFGERDHSHFVKVIGVDNTEYDEE